MKEFIGWIQWSWFNFQFWQKAFIFAIAIQAISWLFPLPVGLYLSSFGVAIILGFIFKWAIWDTARSSWTKYKAYRNELLSTIKNSEKNEQL